MIRAKTCLVLGAGASVPYNLPTGANLKDLILASRSPSAIKTAPRFPLKDAEGNIIDFRRDHTIPEEKKSAKAVTAWSSYLRTVCASADIRSLEVDRFREKFFRAKSSSIDRFIQFNETEFGTIGRLHIAAALLACEHDFFLYEDWYAQLLDLIAPAGPEDIAEGMLSVLTFNYDRSFEKFFTDAFEAGFNLTPDRARALLAKIRIRHVYGQLGSITQVPYGEQSLAKAIIQQIDLVRPCADEERRQKIHELIEDAENICFIGFAFAAENLGLFDTELLKKKKVFATVLGMPRNRVAEVERQIPNITCFSGTAYDLLQQYDIFAPQERVTSPPLPQVKRVQSRGSARKRSLNGL